MKRTEIKRRTPLRAKAHPPRLVKTIEGYTPRPRAVAVAVADTRARMVVPVPKAAPQRDESYRRWVASLPCINCGQVGRSQAAHGPTLGRGIKADDRTCVPLCADSPGWQGCHTRVDQYREYPRAERAAKFARWQAQVRALWELTHINGMAQSPDA